MKAFKFILDRRSHMRLNAKPKKALTRPWRNLYATGRIGNDQDPARPRDLNQWAKRMVDIATGEASNRAPPYHTRTRSSESGEKEDRAPVLVTAF